MKRHYFMALALTCCAGMTAFAANPTAGTPEKVASSATGLMAPVWSPDGSQIAATGANYTGIYVFNSDGSNGVRLTDAEGAGYKMAWSADGKEIVGRTNVREGIRVLHEMKAWDASTGEVRTVVPRQRTNATPRTINGTANLLQQMTEDAAGVTSKVNALNEFAGRTVINPALSPDGSLIAFQIVGKGLFVINADGTNLRSLGKGSHPSWLPDNATVIYSIVTDNGSAFTGSTIMSYDLATDNAAVVMKNDKMIPLTPVVSPDGTRMAFENAADEAIYVVTLK